MDDQGLRCRPHTGPPERPGTVRLRLDDVGEIPFVPFLVEVLQLRTGMLGMLREVEVRAVGHTFQLSIAWGGEGEAVFHVERAASIFGVVGQFIGIMGPQQEILALHSDRAPPVLPGFTPEFIPLWCIVTVAEEFEFHLFKFPGTENEVPWGHFVAERFPIWAMPKGTRTRECRTHF